jgi:DNA-binding HxlR family transcriptional regulator
MRKQRHEDYIECPIEGAMDVIGGKWKGSILFRLLECKRRFSELQRLLTKITQRTLTQQLRDLERDGLISRHVFAEVPPRVEYSLTERGKSLEPVLRQLKSWGEEFVLPGQGVSASPAPKRARKPATPDPTSAARSKTVPAARRKAPAER